MQAGRSSTKQWLPGACTPEFLTTFFYYFWTVPFRAPDGACAVPARSPVTSDDLFKLPQPDPIKRRRDRIVLVRRVFVLIFK